MLHIFLTKVKIVGIERNTEESDYLFENIYEEVRALIMGE